MKKRKIPISVLKKLKKRICKPYMFIGITPFPEPRKDVHIGSIYHKNLGKTYVALSCGGSEWVELGGNNNELD